MKNYIPEIAKVNKQDRFDAIVKVLEENGISYVVQPVSSAIANGSNIIVPAKNQANKIVISAHYDNVMGTPGANDNASACSILLNLILDNKDKENSIEFVFFDLEECGFIGSRKYARISRSIELVYNLDMCGLGENILVSTSHLDAPTKSIVSSNLSKYGGYEVKMLPPGDAYTFIKLNYKTIYVVNSTNHDLAWFKAYANGEHSKDTPDFLKTMHQSNDTPSTCNLAQVEKIYKFVKDCLNI